MVTNDRSDPAPARPRPSVIFVREWEQQMTSSGCCGRVEGDFLDFGSGSSSSSGRYEVPETGETGDRDGNGPRAPRSKERVFAERRKKMEEVGVLYRAVRNRFGDAVDIGVVDPRNLLSLIPILWQEGRRHGVPVGETLRSLLRLSVNMVILDGRILSRKEWPRPAELLERIEVSRGSEDPRWSPPSHASAKIHPAP